LSKEVRRDRENGDGGKGDAETGSDPQSNFDLTSFEERPPRQSRESALGALVGWIHSGGYCEGSRKSRYRHTSKV
jgi:hypothetical protein